MGAARRRILEDEEPSASTVTVNANHVSVDGAEAVDVKPGPSGLNASAQQPITNGLTKRGQKRRMVIDDDDDDDDEDASNGATAVEEDDTSHLTKSQDDYTKGKALRRREVATAAKIEPEESSSEDEKPIR